MPRRCAIPALCLICFFEVSVGSREAGGGVTKESVAMEENEKQEQAVQSAVESVPESNVPAEENVADSSARRLG